MTPFGTRSSLLIKIATACLLVLVAMWVRLFVLIDNNYSDAINRAEQRVLSKSQIFAEFALAATSPFKLQLSQKPASLCIPAWGL